MNSSDDTGMDRRQFLGACTATMASAMGLAGCTSTDSQSGTITEPKKIGYHSYAMGYSPSEIAFPEASFLNVDAIQPVFKGTLTNVSDTFFESVTFNVSFDVQSSMGSNPIATTSVIARRVTPDESLRFRVPYSGGGFAGKTEVALIWDVDTTKDT